MLSHLHSERQKFSKWNSLHLGAKCLLSSQWKIQRRACLHLLLHYHSEETPLSLLFCRLNSPSSVSSPDLCSAQYFIAYFRPEGEF